MSNQVPVGRSGLVALVDTADYDRISKHRWFAQRVGNHRNHDGLDNRRDNLRPATQTQNNGNQRCTRGVSRFKGVSWYERHGKWFARIQHEGRRRSIGYFKDELVAAEAYDAAARELFGEYACVNFPVPQKVEREGIGT